MTDIPLCARVECAGGPCGRATYVIINPTTQRVTHFVVRGKGLHRTERLVPVDQVKQTTRDVISLCCTGDELAGMEPFTETWYVQVEHPRDRDYPYPSGVFAHRDNGEWLPVKHERIPPGELAVRRGAPVEATDGRVGRVEGFLMDPASGSLTQLVLREGHAWAQKDVAIPVSKISRIGERAVYLQLDKRGVESLPAVPVKWH